MSVIPLRDNVLLILVLLRFDGADVMNMDRTVVCDNRTSDHALRFNILCARLLSVPLLSEKWGILKLLQELSKPSIKNEPERRYSTLTVPLAASWHGVFNSRGLHRLLGNGMKQSNIDNLGEDDTEPKYTVNGMRTKVEILTGHENSIGNLVNRQFSSC